MRLFMRRLICWILRATCTFVTQNQYVLLFGEFSHYAFFRCCQNGLVSVWTVPQDISNFPESCYSDSEGWWENEAKPKFMVLLFVFKLLLLETNLTVRSHIIFFFPDLII